MPSLICFDLDDTLYKERQYVASGFRAVAAEVAPAAGLNERMVLQIMRSAPNAFDSLAALIAHTPAAEVYTIPRMVEIYRAHKPEITPTPGTEEVLAELKRRGHVMGIITDGNPTRQHAKIKALGLEKYFDAGNITVSEDTPTDKHTPYPFAAAERLAPGLPRYYIGDNVSKDFHWPNLRGWNTVMLRDFDGVNIFPQDPMAVPPEFRARTTVDSISELLKITT